MTFGQFLYEYRVREQLTQTDLAKRCGVTQGAIGNYENGLRLPNRDVLGRMARGMHVPVTELLAMIYEPKRAGDRVAELEARVAALEAQVSALVAAHDLGSTAHPPRLRNASR